MTPPPSPAPAPGKVAPGTPPPSSPAAPGIVDYLVAWGVGGPSAQTLARALEARVDPAVTEPAPRTAAMLETFDRWIDGLAEALGDPAEADRVALVVAMYGPRLLDAHPEALDRPTDFHAALRGRLGVWEHGVLPKLEHQAMHRQPLGDLPRVLRGEFWSGTYRWVMPSSERAVRRSAKADGETLTPPLAADPAPPGPATT